MVVARVCYICEYAVVLFLLRVVGIFSINIDGVLTYGRSKGVLFGSYEVCQVSNHIWG